MEALEMREPELHVGFQISTPIQWCLMNFEKSESQICFFAFVVWKWNIQRDVSHCAHFSAREQAQVFSCDSGHDLE